MSKNPSEENFDGLAPRLLSPPTPPASLRPPARPPLHELPLGELSWEDFERLAWRLVALQGEVRQTTLYGTPGQKQEGIDLLAELRTGDQAVYQCKRLERMTPAEVRTAVDRFLEGEWSTSAKTFGLFTRVSLRETSLANEVSKQTKRLRERGITFERLDLDEISLRCKDAADLVWDFFGTSWASEFCGPDKVAGLVGRLRPEEAVQLRRDLREFYLRSFAEHDFLPPHLLDDKPPAFSDRFVPVEVVERQRASAPARDERSAVRPVSPDDHNGGSSTSEAGRRNEHSDGLQGSEAVRQPVWEWLAGGTRSVLLGPGGQGKSTILRVLACALLADEPSPSVLASKWAGYVPVWVPFPSWVERLSSGERVDLRGTVRRWLEDRGQGPLVALVDRAFDDGRIILVVDGLDEYVNEEAAMDAFQRLLVEQGQRGVPMIAAGRPGPTFRLRAGFERIRHSALAPLSAEQQRALVEHRLAADRVDQDLPAEHANKEGERFFHELARAPAAAGFADSPLMLTMLLRVWQAGGRLPEGRCELLRGVVRTAIAEHPRGRRVASGVGRPAGLPDDRDIAGALAALAYRIRLQGFSLPLPEVERALLDHAENAASGLGMPRTEARTTSKALVTWLRDHLDILEQDGQRLALRHRVLLEYLVAVHLGAQEPDVRLQAVTEHAADPGWQEVWPDLFALLGDADDALTLFEAIRARRVESPDAFHLDLALTAAAVSDGVWPAPIRIEWLKHIQTSVRTCSWWPHKAELVKLVTQGLLRQDVADTVDSILSTWIPRRHEWPPALVDAVATWPPTADLVDELVQVVSDHDDVHARLGAARALARMGLQAPPPALVQLARQHTDPLSLASALDALAEAWPASAEALALAQRAASGSSRELTLARWLLDLQRGERPAVPLEAIAGTAHDRRLDLAFHGLLGEVLARAWSGDLEMRDTLLGLARTGRNSKWGRLEDGDEVDLDFVRKVLIVAFPGDDSVAAYLAEWLDAESHGPYDHEVWETLQSHFRRHSVLADAVDRWLPRSSVYMEDHRARAALVSGSDQAKVVMLDDLARGSFPWWPASALVEGWSIDDPQVRQAIKASVVTSPENAASLAHYLHMVEPDASSLRERLLGLLTAVDRGRTAPVVSALGSLKGSRHDEEAARLVAQALEGQPPVHSFAWPAAFSSFLWHPEIKARAVEALAHPEAPIASIGRGCASDPDLRAAVMRTVAPLPVDLRRAVWQELARLGPASARAGEWLARYDLEHDATAKTIGSIGWARCLRLGGPPSPEDIEQIRAGLACRGHNHEVRRQAALAAALELGVEHLLEGLTTEGMPDHPAAVSLTRGYGGTNAPLLDAVAGGWDRLQGALGESVLERLCAKHIEDPNQINNLLFSDRTFEALLDHARRSTALEGKLLRVIEAAPHRSGSPPVLRFLKRSRPQSPLLREFCLGTLEGHAQNAYWIGAQIVAAEILADAFATDSEVFDRIAEGRDGPLPPRAFAKHHPARLYCLGLARPDGKTLTDLWTTGAKEEWSDPFGQGVSALAQASAEQVVALLDEWATDQLQFVSVYGKALQHLLRRRFDRDVALADAVGSLVLRSRRHFVTLAPIALGRVGDATQADILHRVIIDELALEGPSLEGDLFTGEVVSALELAASLQYGRER